METDLDDQLIAAAPPVAARTPALRHALADLVDRTETANGTRRAPRRASVGVAALALTAVAGVGAAAAAAATGWDPGGWWDRPDAVTHESTTDSGQPCRVTYAPRAVHDDDHPVSADDRAAAMTAAADFLRRLDYSTVDGMRPNAAFDELNARLTQALARQGLSVYAVGVALATDCETER
jgi:hypothetical protein